MTKATEKSNAKLDPKADPVATGADETAADAQPEPSDPDASTGIQSDAEPTPAPPTRPKKVVTIPECEVQIERNEVTKFGATVYFHEVPILKAVHGEDRIKVLDTYDVQVTDFKVIDEYERLKRRYNNKQTGDVVAKAYPMGYLQLADELGIAPDRSQSVKTVKVASQNEGNARRTKR